MEEGWSLSKSILTDQLWNNFRWEDFNTFWALWIPICLKQERKWPAELLLFPQRAIVSTWCFFFQGEVLWTHIRSQVRAPRVKFQDFIFKHHDQNPGWVLETVSPTIGSVWFENLSDLPVSGCYSLFDVAETWDKVNETCRGLHTQSHLVSLETAEVLFYWRRAEHTLNNI